MSFLLIIPAVFILAYVGLKIATFISPFFRKKLQKKWESKPRLYLEETRKNYREWKDLQGALMPKTLFSRINECFILSGLIAAFLVFILRDLERREDIAEYKNLAASNDETSNFIEPKEPYAVWLYPLYSLVVVINIGHCSSSFARRDFCKWCLKEVTGEASLESFDTLDYVDTTWHESHSSSLTDAELVGDRSIESETEREAE